MSDAFYRAFENKFRGSRDLIKSRLQIYLPYVLPVLESDPYGKSLDIGCGRGEWLELLGECGFDASGVDLDDGMLQACRDIGLNVQNIDALTYIKNLPDHSLSLISGFHIAEHLPFDLLLKIVTEVKRVLKPGGLLILETPNPENLDVGTSKFYLDPTHNRPIPPELLSFLPDYCGYVQIKTIRLSHYNHENTPKELSLSDVIYGSSPDYAVIAQATPPEVRLQELDIQFMNESHNSLQQIVSARSQKGCATTLMKPLRQPLKLFVPAVLHLQQRPF